ncbi:MAG: hypothetical protein JRC88_03835 [Deltaproteobacteria bacterium]|nr:hypothetical protein [Deltaproteobacteria bacterium]
MNDPLVKERLSKNLMAWPDITAFCLELRKSFLKSRYSSMDDKKLIKKLFAEIVANKEKNWTSKRHL